MAEPDNIPPAYTLTANQVGVPAEVLFALARTESNTRLTIGYYPWPWTLNIKGKGYRYKTREEACAAITDAIKRHGVYGVDIGLSQQNWGYVGKNWFTSPCAALEPLNNLLAAAQQLRKYHERTGDWITAAGMYHRPAGGKHAFKYVQKLCSHLSKKIYSGCSENPFKGVDKKYQE